MVAIRPAAFSLIAQITITIAVGILIRGSALLIWGKDSVTLPAFSKGGPLRLLGASVNVQSLWIFAITILILVSLYLFFRHTIQGKALMACADNQAVARLVGINPHTMALVAFGIAALIGAIGGIISTPVTRMGYSMGLPFTFKGFCAAVIGGMDSLMGGVFAGLALGVIESLAGGMLVSAYKDVFTFAIVAIIIFYQVFRISRLERGI
jgi:branched-chain amino acid transport system permease protein